MRELFRPYRNWRTHVLTLLGLAAVVLLIGETDSIATLLATKPLGFLVAYLTYRLGRYWDSKGKINELMELANEE